MRSEYVGDHAVPYYSQKVDFLSREGSLEPEQIHEWKDSLCGLVCVGMIINRFSQGSQYTIAEFLIAADKLGAFDQKRGWVHKKIGSLADGYGIKANARKAISLDTVYKLLARGDLIMASVSPYYLHPELKEKKDERSGHLVVITGMNRRDAGSQVFIHDPSSEYADGGQNIAIDSSVLEHSFSGNIISFENPHKQQDE